VTSGAARCEGERVKRFNEGREEGEGRERGVMYAPGPTDLVDEGTALLTEEGRVKVRKGRKGDDAVAVGLDMTGADLGGGAEERRRPESREWFRGRWAGEAETEGLVVVERWGLEMVGTALAEGAAGEY